MIQAVIKKSLSAENNRIRDQLKTLSIRKVLFSVQKYEKRIINSKFLI